MVGAVGLATGEAYRYLRRLHALWRVEVAVNTGAAPGAAAGRSGTGDMEEIEEEEHGA